MGKLGKLRKSSTRVTLVLIGVAALSGCGEGDQRRDVYASREDCLADWGNKPEDCTPATERRHSGRGYFYGPSYAYRSASSGSVWNRGSSSSPHSSGSSRSIGSSGASRGGFGSSGHSASG
jgi:uncharacterized protein YgiB involved in biofilm formation